MNVNVTPVISALLFSITHFVSSNICTVFKRQQLDIARRWTRCTFEGFLVLEFANYKHLVKSNKLINNHVISISLFTLFFFPRNCMFYLNQSLHMQQPRKYCIRPTRADVFLTLKGNIAEHFQNSPSVQNPRLHRQRVTTHF